jgi:hypothetical protein
MLTSMNLDFHQDDGELTLDDLAILVQNRSIDIEHFLRDEKENVKFEQTDDRRKHLNLPNALSKGLKAAMDCGMGEPSL